MGNSAKIDLAKRRRVMQRSQQLGHCICDPRKACPCDVLLQRDVCPCAGERASPAPAGQVKLTELVHNAGCASKIPPAELEAVLAGLPAVNDPAVLCGLAAGDDAGIYRLPDGSCIVQTVDVFTPCVDAPFTFGRICAANCLSDIYAMGGLPRTALSILCFPSDRLDGQIMRQMLQGAMQVLAQAGCALIGGHSIKDEEIKLGFAITGTIDAAAATRRDRAAVGDRLVLTKPLGSGVLTFCRQIGRSGGADLAGMEAAMATLNAAAAEAMRESGASACTDITGFGLFGHLIGMARHSGVTAEVWADALPAFAGALEALAAGVVPGAIERNGEYVAADIDVAGGVEEARVHLGFDAQTSGGLLIAVSAQRHAALLAALARRDVPAWTIGRISAATAGRISVINAGQPGGPSSAADSRPAQENRAMAKDRDDEQEDCCRQEEPSCCAGAERADSDSDEGETTAPAALRAFGELMRNSAAGGALDEKTKELIAFALIVHSRCGACFEAHLARARKMGIKQAELEEAAWCAVAMGGAPVRMFYLEAMKEGRRP